ncbi:MAG: hypothetical protein KKE42_01170 [Alphaproteobacteria bacterium]|uniref:hypothetical protein n=1 Tax=Brevundimonas sp. TaxID=1871086 RepID=UPI0012296940|nr:hypothetical protein [Brevundimonas sp.]MBU3971300.1 hypothetical protein [Alphaproteobacteria bacterium]MBA3050869.1 hypothetical protein [Brevundimonas sp.]MBU3972389.1 hypothetical protein [Alphaproteobacteria bacterium]MBU4040693.1 hypothetical protein [Alphaproteobacteria bacterium]MBU4137689.1 hypothetical protein [Alphaproteobacteria bacterium]
MESLFDSIGAFLTGVFGLAQGGFDTINQVTGLIIAVIATFMMPSWGRLWATSLGSALVFILVGLLRPLLDGGAFVMPPLLTMTFWMTVLALFLGFAVVIAVMFFIKSLFTGGGHGHRRHAH